MWRDSASGPRCLTILALLCAGLTGFGSAGIASADESLVRKQWSLDNVEREALVYVPADAPTRPCPVVFAFHGHGGSMKNAAQKFALHQHWPEAIAVYMQGLNTPGALTDPEGKRPGWQHRPGDQDDRDLKFFDAVLATLKKDHRVDEKQIYSTGHSNGGGFTYLLWATRGDVFAAMAPSAAAARPQLLEMFKPKPVLHAAGEQDPLVRFAWQKSTIDALRKLNGCGEGQHWDRQCTLYPSPTGTPVVAFIHPGGHQFLAETPALIVKFFQQQAKP